MVLSVTFLFIVSVRSTRCGVISVEVLCTDVSNLRLSGSSVSAVLLSISTLLYIFIIRVDGSFSWERVLVLLVSSLVRWVYLTEGRDAINVWCSEIQNPLRISSGSPPIALTAGFSFIFLSLYRRSAFLPIHEVVNTPASYLRDRLYGLWCFVIFLSPSRQMAGWYIKLGHDRFFPHLFIINLYTILSFDAI